MRVIQLLPALHQGDAIGSDALKIRDHFRDRGLASEILFIQADVEVASEGMHYHGFKQVDGPDTVTILHYALPSPLDDLFRNAKGKKIIVYHNITPPDFLKGYPLLQRLALVGREVLQGLHGVPDVSVADSRYSCLELEMMGFKNPREIPIYIDFGRFHCQPNPVLMEMFRDDFTNILFVGRVTPNKCQHDLIRMYGYFKRFVRERCRLFIVGKWDGFEKYYFQLMKLAEKLKLGDVYLTGRVDHEELVTYYRLADVFVSMSEHEGFGVPLVESMFYGIPVLAYKAGAVPFTMGGAGILFKSKQRWRELSEMTGFVAAHGDLRNAVLKKQRERLTYFSENSVGKLWDQAVLG